MRNLLVAELLTVAEYKAALGMATELECEYYEILPRHFDIFEGSGLGCGCRIR